jgi:hypothetical protein
MVNGVVHVQKADSPINKIKVGEAGSRVLQIDHCHLSPSLTPVVFSVIAILYSLCKLWIAVAKGNGTFYI